MDTQDRSKKLRDLLIGHEGFSQFPYEDTTGHITIGFGRNLTDRGISHHEALTFLDNDIDYFIVKLNHHLAFFDRLDDIRRMVLIDMCFNVGIRGLLDFKNMLAAIEEGNYELAAEEMMDSKWASQVKGRASQLAYMMRTGEM